MVLMPWMARSKGIERGVFGLRELIGKQQYPVSTNNVIDTRSQMAA